VEVESRKKTITGHTASSRWLRGVACLFESPDEKEGQGVRSQDIVCESADLAAGPGGADHAKKLDSLGICVGPDGGVYTRGGFSHAECLPYRSRTIFFTDLTGHPQECDANHTEGRLGGISC